MTRGSQRRTLRRRQSVVFLALVCIVTLVAASQVEAAHFCQLTAAAAGREASAQQSEGAAPRICPICATAHQASMGAAQTPAPPTFEVTASAAPVAPQPHSRLQVFTLDVRPPPLPAV